MRPCDHGMPTPASCIDCMDEGNIAPVRREPVTVEARFPARFPGQCPGCNLAIHEGEQIVRMSDDTYRHGRCA